MEATFYCFLYLGALPLNSYKKAKHKKNTIVGFGLTEGKPLNSFFKLICHFSVSLNAVLRPLAGGNNQLLKRHLG